MQVKEVNIETISENKENPRFIKSENFEKLKKSIQDFPEMMKLRPIIVNEDNVALWWNMRLKACKELWIEKVFVVKANDLTPEQQKEFVIKDNVWYWDWDLAMLWDDYDEELLNEWGLDVDLSSDDDEDDFDRLWAAEESTDIKFTKWSFIYIDWIYIWIWKEMTDTRVLEILKDKKWKWETISKEDFDEKFND